MNCELTIPLHIVSHVDVSCLSIHIVAIRCYVSLHLRHYRAFCDSPPLGGGGGGLISLHISPILRTVCSNIGHCMHRWYVYHLGGTAVEQSLHEVEVVGLEVSMHLGAKLP